MNNREKLLELLKNEAFFERILALDEPTDVQAAFEEEDVELSIQEIEQLGEMIRKLSEGEISQEQIEQAANGELSEDEMEQVAGGVVGEILLGTAAVVFIGGYIGGVDNKTIKRWFRRW